MWKKLFAENAVKNTVTLFHKPGSAGSGRILQLLKATSAESGKQVVGEKGEKSGFELDVVEGPPTSDQLRNIIEYVGERNAGQVVDGAMDAQDAQRRIRLDLGAMRRPLVVDWNAGKVVIGENEAEVKKMVE